MLKKLIHYIRSRGVEYEHSYQDKKDLIAYNSTFMWTTVLLFINIFISYFAGLRHVAVINTCAAVVFSCLIVFNNFGSFRITRHVGVILANIYVYIQSIACGPDLQFQYGYCIIITMIGLIFTNRWHLYIHLAIVIAFFVVTKVSYYYFEPWENIPLEERDYFAFNNGIIFLVLISASAVVFRNQTNLFLKEIEQKKNLIEEKQKEIYDSINYAERIQSAILNNKQLIDDLLGKDKYFILFQPKDIVSGDFYWATHIRSKENIKDGGFEVKTTDDLFYIAVCDSTGHGVPGAFMSLLNMGFLSESVRERQIYQPNKIFDYVRSRLEESISNEGQKDGFDGILVCINKTSGQITYAAANNNPVVVSGKIMKHLPADKMPVGRGAKEEPFKLYHLDYAVGDRLYLYTDGYADQFGGPNGKKFKYRQLEEAIQYSSGRTFAEQEIVLENKFLGWKGDLEQVDDVCVMGIGV
jgi:serine phosphatase RsbU (regulator of sigma subunit)